MSLNREPFDNERTTAQYNRLTVIAAIYADTLELMQDEFSFPLMLRKG